MHAGPRANRVIQRAEGLAAQIEASARSTAAKVNDHGLAVHRLQPLLEVRHQILGDQSHRRAAARAQRQRRLLLNLQNRRHSPAAIFTTLGQLAGCYYMSLEPIFLSSRKCSATRNCPQDGTRTFLLTGAAIDGLDALMKDSKRVQMENPATVKPVALPS